MRALPLLPNHFPKAPPPNTFTVRIKFEHTNVGEKESSPPLKLKTNVQAIAMYFLQQELEHSCGKKILRSWSQSHHVHDESLSQSDDEAIGFHRWQRKIKKCGVYFRK